MTTTAQHSPTDPPPRRSAPNPAERAEPAERSDAAAPSANSRLPAAGSPVPPPTALAPPEASDPGTAFAASRADGRFGAASAAVPPSAPAPPEAADPGTVRTDSPAAAGPAADAGLGGLSAWSVLRRMAPLLRPHRTGLVLTGCAVLAATLCETAAIRVFAYLTDHVLATGRLAAFWAPAGLWAGTAVAGAALGYAGTLASGRIGETVLLGLRDRLFAHLQRLSPDFHDNAGTGDLVARCTSDVESLSALLTDVPVEAATAAASVLLFSAAALWTRWDLALLCFALAPLFWVCAGVLGSRVDDRAEAERAANGELTEAVQEGLAQLRLVQVYAQEGAQQARIHARGAAWRRAVLSQLRWSALFGPLTEVVEALAVIAVIGAGAWEIGAHRLTLGGLLAFAAYLGYLYPHVQGLGSLRVEAAQATAAAERVLALLDTPPAVVDRAEAAFTSEAAGAAGAAGAPGAAGAVAAGNSLAEKGNSRNSAPIPARRTPDGDEFRHAAVVSLEKIEFRYPGSARPVLSDLSHTARPGRLVLVEGRSGSGKSTLAQLLVRFYDPTGGRILINGRDIRDLPLNRLRTLVTLMPQETQVVRGSIAENIAFGRPDAGPAAIRDAARAADLHTFAERLPAGYDTPIGTDGRLLSGGQLRRLAIARALLRDSPVLVLDEPTTGLDARTTRRLLTPLRQLMAHRTTFLITHDPELAKIADEIIRIDSN